MTNHAPIRIFVASPGDVLQERDALSKLVTELNSTIAVVAPEKGVSLELVRWETHTRPAAGRPQGVINDQIGDYDVFIGVMWQRFGTPTGEAESGTEEEFKKAYEHWELDGKPRIMFYFCQTPAPPATKSVALVEQLKRVAMFREELQEKALIAEYGDHSEFSDVVRPHLLLVLAEAIGNGSVDKTRDTIAATQTSDTIRDNIRALADEYKSIRTAMPSSEVRNREMELVVTRMRTIALAGYALLPTLSVSQQPGERLAAAAMLQVLPSLDYVTWLGERLSEDQAFLAYQACLALLISARKFGCEQSKPVAQAIQGGLTRLGNRQETDRFRVLTSAMDELRKRCPNSQLLA